MRRPACSPMTRARSAAGSPRTKAAQRWREEHPEFDRLKGESAAFARTALGHLHRGDSFSLLTPAERAALAASAP